MALQLPVKQGISAFAVRSIPQQWDAEWFRRFVSNYLQNADVRNASGAGGITVTGTVVQPGVISNQGIPVTNLAPIPNNTVIGNISGATASPIALNKSQLTALINVFTSSLNGAVPASGGSSVNLLHGDVTWGPVALTSISTINNNTVLGNNTGSLAAPIALTQTQLTALVNTFTSSLSGTVPASGGGSTRFLNADGAFTVPAGTASSANPSAKVGPSATNGTAVTYMTSDSAPALDLGSSTNYGFGGKVGINGATPPSKVTGWGTPTGNSVVNNFPGATATLTQVSNVVAQLIVDLKAFGLYSS